MTQHRYRRSFLVCFGVVVILHRGSGFGTPQLYGVAERHRPCTFSQSRVFSQPRDSDSAAGSSANGVTSDNFLSKNPFVDASTAISNRASSTINQLDRKAKSALNGITGKDEYEFGDLTRWADAQAKAKVTEFTGKKDYEVGDVSKEILRRISTEEYSFSDMIFLLRVLISLTGGLNPIAELLPMKFLLHMVNFSLAEEVGERVLGALSLALDERFKLALTGDAKYQIGDKTKQAILQFIEKENYTFGDISRAAASKIDEKAVVEGIGLAKLPARQAIGAANVIAKEGFALDPGVVAEVEAWDRRLKGK